MSGPGNETPSGDSTPSFEFLREHDDGSRTKWPVDFDHDSATDMLPPEEEQRESEADPDVSAEPDDGETGSGSSIHAPLRPAASSSPGSDAEPENDTETPAVATTSTDSHDGLDTIETAIPDREDPAIPAEERVGTAAAEATIDEAPSTPLVPGSNGAPGNLLVVALASYASAVTLALLYLLFQRGATDPSLLESLPDVPPLQEGEVLRWVPVDAEMPAGHSLALGESQRFGNIVVTPLRVVREPLTFTHYSGRDDLTRPPTEPIVKLWVRFTNVSQEQSIAPLDGELLFTRVFNPETGETRANQFVCPLDVKRVSGDPVFIYDYTPTDEFDLAGQQLGRVLKPGESYETYIPTGEVTDELRGELVWRLHFRKGYSPKGFGVTTVVEVRFSERNIQSNSAAT